jgi:methionyl-tRNA synthetase
MFREINTLDEEPWCDKTDAGRVQTANVCGGLQIAAALSSLCEPFLAFTIQIIKILNIESPLNGVRFQILDLLPVGHQIGEAEPFPKVEDEEIRNK